MRRDVQEIFKLTPHDKQVMMFSATLSKEIRPVCKKFMQDVIFYLCGDFWTEYGSIVFLIPVNEHIAVCFSLNVIKVIQSVCWSFWVVLFVINFEFLTILLFYCKYSANILLQTYIEHVWLASSNGNSRIPGHILKILTHIPSCKCTSPLGES